MTSPPGLPPRPGQPGFPSTVDELVAGGARQGDDIDQLIRMAEAGIKPPKKDSATPTVPEAVPADEAAPEKRTKKEKDKNVQMIYDDELSPEERMALMPKYAFVATAAQG